MHLNLGNKQVVQLAVGDVVSSELVAGATALWFSEIQQIVLTLHRETRYNQLDMSESLTKINSCTPAREP